MPSMRRLPARSHLSRPRLRYADCTRDAKHGNVGDPRENVSDEIDVDERSVVLPCESRTSATGRRDTLLRDGFGRKPRRRSRPVRPCDCSGPGRGDPRLHVRENLGVVCRSARLAHVRLAASLDRYTAEAARIGDEPWGRRRVCGVSDAECSRSARSIDDRDRVTGDGRDRLRSVDREALR